MKDVSPYMKDIVAYYLKQRMEWQVEQVEMSNIKYYEENGIEYCKSSKDEELIKRMKEKGIMK